MQIAIDSVIHVTNPSAAIIKWCQDNLVISNPEYTKKMRMHLWLGRTPKYLYLYAINGNTYELPYGCLRNLVSLLGAMQIETNFKPATKTYYGTKNVPLYDYQRRGMNELINAQYGILQAPPGSGKTQIGIALAMTLGRRTLWLERTLDLVHQSKERAEQYIDPLLTGSIEGGKVNIGIGITFATVQTLSRIDLERYKDTWDVIIVDECHHVAGSPTTLTQYYKVLNTLVARHKYGLSATVHRADSLITATFSMLGGVVSTITNEQVGNKIMKVSVQPVLTKTNISDSCLNTDGTINYAAMITYLVNDKDRNDSIFEQMFFNYSHFNLILSSRIDHLLVLQQINNCVWSDSVLITGKTPKAEREAGLEEIKQGTKHYLFATYALAKEGLDIPRLDRLYLATPEKDYAVVAQAVGRIARAFPCKSKPIVYDFIDNIEYLKKCYAKRCTTYRKVGCDIATIPI